MKKRIDDESGFILIAVLVTLMLLVLIGFSATTTTTVEVQIAGNDKINKKTFYGADGGSELGARLVEENVACAGGFTATAGDPYGRTIINNIAVPPDPDPAKDLPLAFWDQKAPANDPYDPPDDGSGPSRDLYYPADYTAGNPDVYVATATAPHTNITVGGTTKYLSGSAIQMVAGYEGKGKGAAAGGGYINYDIIAQRHGEKDSKSEVQIVWRHVIGLEGDCNY